MVDILIWVHTGEEPPGQILEGEEALSVVVAVASVALVVVVLAEVVLVEGGDYFLSTRQPANMSCRPCCFSVNPIIK